jgi:hypothetical protein
MRVRMKDEGDRRAGARRGAETPFEAAFRAGKNHVWHGTFVFLRGPDLERVARLAMSGWRDI